MLGSLSLEDYGVGLLDYPFCISNYVNPACFLCVPSRAHIYHCLPTLNACLYVCM